MKTKAVIITVAVLAVLLLIGFAEIVRTEKVRYTCDRCGQCVFDYPHNILVEDSNGNHIDLTVCTKCLEKYNALPDGQKYLFLDS